ncbi:MAG: DUF6036 family nucleotidyltransferase [Actinomycetia bacterium]|nr:DUF6036 family nucleotidyltransferase [Actinomycetes bacterium]
MSDFQQDGVLQRLTQLDDDLLAIYGLSQRFEITIVGGSALMMMGLSSNERFTTDIDVIKNSTEIEVLLDRYDMNTEVSTFLYKYPENWERRRRHVPFEGQVLDVYTLSNEDLAITKLLSWRKVDQHDLATMLAEQNIDLRKLDAILNDVTELQASLEDEEWISLQNRLASLTAGNLP